MNSAQDQKQWPKALTPSVAMAVTAYRRFPRQYLEAEFDAAMNGGNGATLFALRRIGKSSEAFACAERLQKTGQPVLIVDAEGMTSEAELLSLILQHLPSGNWRDSLMRCIGESDAIAKTVRDLLDRVTGRVRDDVLTYFSHISAAITRGIKNAGLGFLFVDEFPWLCKSILEGDPQNGLKRVNVLLAAMRQWRGAGMRMMLIGSIGLVALGRNHGLDLEQINDLTSLTVPPLTREESEAFVNALAVGGKISSWTSEHTFALIQESAACYPSILQVAFQQLTIGGRAAELGRFPEIFAVKIRPDLDERFYVQFDKRKVLYKTLPAPLPGLLSILLETVLARSPVSRHILRQGTNAETEEADLTDALRILREDGFLNCRIERDGAQIWSASSELVMAWWRQRRGGPR